jgi:adenine specific DNA methylase Mod
MTNELHFGDNLDVLRAMPATSIDLIYLDPPFNSKASYNVLYGTKRGGPSQAQVHTFEDTWTWDRVAERALEDAAKRHLETGALLDAFQKVFPRSNMMAYLAMMAVRLIEMRRVLKHTGSLYLHCDPTASHYLKLLLDTIFGPINFRNEIIWQRSRAHNDKKIRRFGAVHDTILFYSRSPEWVFNVQYPPRKQGKPKTHDLYRHSDGKLYRKDNCRAPGDRGPRYEWNGHTFNWRFSIEERNNPCLSG